MPAHFVDNRRRVVLLLFRRKTLAIIENESLLRGRFLSLLRLGDGRDELSRPASLNGLLRGLPAIIQLPMPRWAFVRGIQYRVIEERVRHWLRLWALEQVGIKFLCAFSLPLHR